jgi:hypothetical protein
MEDFGFLGFLKFAAYYVILKAVIQILHLNARNNGNTVVAGVSGLLA